MSILDNKGIDRMVAIANMAIHRSPTLLAPIALPQGLKKIELQGLLNELISHHLKNISTLDREQLHCILDQWVKTHDHHMAPSLAPEIKNFFDRCYDAVFEQTKIFNNIEVGSSKRSAPPRAPHFSINLPRRSGHVSETIHRRAGSPRNVGPRSY